MTEELLPGLGSGALREALGELLGKFERHATYRLISQDETELTGNFRWLPTGKCYIEEVRYQQMLALSLSSPIEPRLADQVSILRTTCDCHIATIEAMQREIDELKALASSEIREALKAQIEKLMAFHQGGTSWDAGYRTALRDVLVQDALALSRQGAAKRVEG